MKILKLDKFINESYDRYKDPNYVVSGFSIGDIKNKIDKEYNCDLQVDVYDDVIMFTDEDANMNFSIERIPRKIICSDGIKQCLIELGYDENQFES